MIDLHCHILPGVDDGAKSMEEAIEMARIAQQDGIKKIAATPHYIEDGCYPSPEEIHRKVEELNHKLSEENIDIEILTGNEAYISPTLPELVQQKKVNTINDTQYLLIEFPMLDIPNYTEHVLYELKLMGITPIIIWLHIS